MYIMNLIHEICINKYYINITPKWKFITKRKRIKNFNDSISKFMDLDIFSLSDNVISFLLSWNKETETVAGYLYYNDSCLCIEVLDNDNNIKVDYYPKSNRFEIRGYVSYSIYRNTKTSKYINGMWEPLTEKIKERYLEIILQIAEYISLEY